jgi:hypothetical protein
MKMAKLSSVFVAAATLGAALPATAAPTLYPRSGNRLSEVTNPSKAVVISDTADRNVQWVLPPATGGTELTGVSLTANVGFCEEMAFLQGTSRQLAERIAARSLEIDEKQPEIEALYGQLADLREDAARANTPEIQLINAARDRIEDIEYEIDDLRDALRDCDTDQCEDDIEEDIQALRAERTELRAEVRDLERLHRTQLRAYETANNLVDAKQDEIDDVERRLDNARESLLRARSQIFEMYRQYGTLEGGFGNVDFDTGWDTAIQQLRDANSGRGFVFTPIPTREVRIFPQILPGFHSDNYLAGLPAVLAYTVAGRTVRMEDNEHTFAALPPHIPANMRLSLIGACPIARPESWDLPENQSGSPLFGLRAEYQYPSAFRTNVTVTYNLWKVYEYMKSVSVDGGLFSTSTEVNESESTDEGTRWTFNFFDESGLTPDQIKEIKATIKAELMADVLRVMAVPSASAQSGTRDLMPAPQSGAVVLANGISDTCGWWSPYCVGASWALRGLQAIFGGSETETRYQSQHNTSVSRSYADDAIQYRPATTAFVR